MEHWSPKFLDPVIGIADPGFKIFDKAKSSILTLEILAQPSRTTVSVRVQIAHDLRCLASPMIVALRHADRIIDPKNS
jgi:hypothetical protein